MEKDLFFDFFSFREKQEESEWSIWSEIGEREVEYGGRVQKGQILREIVRKMTKLKRCLQAPVDRF